MSQQQQQQQAVRSRASSTTLRDITTELAISLFADNVLLIITQNGKMGTLLQAQRDQSLQEGANSYDVRTLLGKRDCLEYELIARQAIELLDIALNTPSDEARQGAMGSLAGPTSFSVVVGLSLLPACADLTPAEVKHLMRALKDMVLA